MKKYISNIKSYVKSINKQNTKEFMLVHKNALIVMIAIVLLGGIITAASYAYYQTLANQSIVGGQVGTISNINMYVFVEDKNASTGAGLGTYSRSIYVPQYAYTYNSSLSYCKKGSTLTYNSTTNTFSINNTKDACYVYFDASLAANADIVLNLYTKKNGEYKLTNEVPNNTELNLSLSSCTNGATMSLENNQITVNTTDKTVCNAYLNPYYGPYTYWFSSTNYTFPNLPATTYSTNTSVNAPTYIRTSSVAYEACTRYGGGEICLPANYWNVNSSLTISKLQNEFGSLVTNCNDYTNGIYCNIGYAEYDIKPTSVQSWNDNMVEMFDCIVRTDSTARTVWSSLLSV